MAKHSKAAEQSATPDENPTEEIPAVPADGVPADDAPDEGGKKPTKDRRSFRDLIKPEPVSKDRFRKLDRREDA